ncbi:hypothetical protein GCM10023206_01500 [Acinetobacter puyangensis]|uniref:Uncharacterized protein n=2 Tax=Acinetobacter puyangensis TaxID=1096779 RepID=A0A240E9C5_9GAMM|nr:hypothetical protein SAMN05421731_103238 [Acinetobacter puyangensis]
MIMKQTILLLGTTLLLASTTFAEETTATQASNGLPDNPSLWRVLTYKSGQTLSKTGDAIQRGAENTSQSIQNQNIGERVEQGATSTAQFAKEKTQQATTFGKEKWQQGKEAIIGTPNNGTAPIESRPLTTPIQPADQGNISNTPEN